MIITIDGPAGTGKSTVAKLVGKKLSYFHMDTGAFYRSVTYALQFHAIPIQDRSAIDRFLEEHPLHIDRQNAVVRYFVGELDATDHIRSPEVTNDVSLVSSYQEVRRRLVPVQRELAEGRDLVCEGRDMGTNVFPQADVKIFLTATPEVRATRRFLELQEKGAASHALSYEGILRDIQARDLADSTRALHPLTIPEGAHIIDTSNLPIEHVVEKVIELAESESLRQKRAAIRSGKF